MPYCFDDIRSDLLDEEDLTVERSVAFVVRKAVRV